MGRDVAAAENFAEHGHEVYTIAGHRNPSLVDITESTGGQYFCIRDICDVEQVADCVEVANPDMFVTNHDDLLAAGVVDAVRERAKTMDRRLPLLIPSPNRESARIEWDKSYLRGIIDEIDPKYNPDYQSATTEEEIEEAVSNFEKQDMPVAVKPLGLSGGKAVKLMGPHLADYQEVKKYGSELLDNFEPRGVSLEELLKGHEFTIMAYSDGRNLAPAPATYDYPFREDGDQGPGTGGMGSFTMPTGEQLPFLSETDYWEAVSVMRQVQDRLRAEGKDFKGTLYGSFFMTSEGLKVTEFNARAGDPEMMNAISLLEDDIDLAEVLTAVASGELSTDMVRFQKLASAVVYLVSPDYAYRQGEPREFDLDMEAIKGNGCDAYCASAERDASTGTYRTVGSSRALAFVALGETPWEARGKIDRTIEEGFEGELEYRNDIASKEYIEGLAA
jgi:phosphoribosylamine--glycine ligase